MSYAQENIPLTTRAVQSTSTYKTQEVNRQSETSNLQVDEQPPPHTTNPPDLQQQMRTITTYSQVQWSNNMTNQPGNLEHQLNTFLNEFKAMFTQLINQNSMILNMLSTIITNTLNTGH